MSENRAYAYLRVSTTDQKLDRQYEAIKEYVKANNIELDERNIITDKASGKDFQRSGYIILTQQLLRQGDLLIIKELDRLGRDYEQIKNEWQALLKSGINIIVVDTPILNTTNKTDLEKSLISNIVFELLAYMSEKERLKIKQRQREGIDVAKAQGKHLGRPKAEFPDEWEKVYMEWKDGNITAVKAMKELNLTRCTFYKLAKQHEGALL